MFDVTRTPILLLGISLFGLLLVTACGDSETRPVIPVDNPFETYAIGTDETFEAVTWNLHNFAEDAGTDEVMLAAQVIAGLGADVVAVQEIAQESRFDQLVDALPDWSGYQATSDRYQNLGYIWLDSTVTMHAVSEIMEDQWLAFPRAPLVLELTWRGHDLVLIDNHFKCCGDGTLNVDDEDDEENRRWTACRLLEGWIAAEHPDDAVILLGDLNDYLVEDIAANNVFVPFLEAPSLYRFADMEQAEGSSINWSWGPGRGHLDHILVTDELFPALDADGGRCVTLRIDNAMDGAYTTKLSDHAPVAVILPEAALP